MANYYANTNQQDNGDHEVHVEACPWLPISEHRLYLGNFSNCRDAVREAHRYYLRTNGCRWCSPSCNTG